MLRRSTVTVFVVAAVAGLTARPAHAQIPEGWEIVEIFPAGTEYHCGWPDINDEGQIVFDRRLWPSFFDREIILYDQGELIPLTDDDVWDAFPRINNHGEIVWQRDLDPDPDVWQLGIVRWRNGIIETVAEPPERFSLEGPDINDSGWMVWYSAAEAGNSPYRASVFLYDGSSAMELPNGGFPDQTPRINNFGQIVWTRYDYPRRGRSTIMLFENGQFRYLSDGVGFPQSPHLSDLGDVVWADSAGLYLWTKGTVAPKVFGTVAFPTMNHCSEVGVSLLNTEHGYFGLSLIRGDTPIEIVDSYFGSTAEQINGVGHIVFQSGRVPASGTHVFRRRPTNWDLDEDGDMDLADYMAFQNCVEGFDNEDWCRCRGADEDHSGIVDQFDWSLLRDSFAGPE